MRISPAVALTLLGFAASIQAAPDFVVVEIPASRIAFSAATGKLYATVPSKAGQPYGNSLVEIGIDGSGITRSVFVGSEPVHIGMSPDSAVAYVALQGAAAARRVDLGTMTAGVQFTLGSDTRGDPYYAGDIVTMPGSPDTIAVSRITCCSHQGVAIYDSGVMRPTTTPGHTGSNSIAFGTQPGELFGYNNETSEFGLRRMAITAPGVAVTQVAQNLISGYGPEIIASGGRIYSTSGRAVNAATFTLLGTYGASGPVVVDDALATVYFASANVVFDETTIRTFDRDTFVPMQIDVTFPLGGGVPLRAVSCGLACIAVLQEHDRIVILTNYFSPLLSDSFE